MSHAHSKSRLGTLHRLWRLLPPGPRRALLARASAFAAPRPDRNPLSPQGGVVIAGELSRPSGLGEAARLMRDAVAGLGLPVWEADIGTPGEPCRLLPRDVPEGAPLLLVVNAPTVPWALLRLPRALLRRRRVIAYWAWELPAVPPAWRIGLPFVHEIWGISRFTADALRTLLPPGSPVPVRVAPIPVAEPVPSARRRADFGLPEDALVVLTSFSLASSNVRKNPLGALEAHRRAFGDRPDRILVLKVGNPGHFPEEFAAIAAAAARPNVRLFTETLSRADTHALTACADIVLSLHRSEGFGLVPAEAMMLARPVVATGWSGNMDFMDASSAALVGYRLVPAVDPRGVFEAPGAVWAEPDLDEAAAALRRLADDPEGRVALGRRGAEKVRAALGPHSVAAALRAAGMVVPPPGSRS